MNKYILDDEPKIKTGFIIPEDYFKNFEVTFPVENESHNSAVIQMFNNNKKWILSTAALLIISVTIIFQWVNAENENYTATVENQLLYNSTISDDDIVNLLDEETISKMQIELTISKNEIEQTLIEESTIENYITN